jgi:hypothetical protein
MSSGVLTPAARKSRQTLNPLLLTGPSETTLTVVTLVDEKTVVGEQVRDRARKIVVVLNDEDSA